MIYTLNCYIEFEDKNVGLILAGGAMGNRVLIKNNVQKYGGKHMSIENKMEEQ